MTKTKAFITAFFAPLLALLLMFLMANPFLAVPLVFLLLFSVVAPTFRVEKEFRIYSLYGVLALGVLVLIFLKFFFKVL